jgi:NADH-quinone oxidoreductase subunit H
MNALHDLIVLLIFPTGLFVILLGLAYEWLNRKLLARLQNRVGLRWFQPLADLVKLLAKETVVPDHVDVRLFVALPAVALAGGLTAALYIPMAGFAPAASFPGDLIVAVYLLSLLSVCTALAGSNTMDRYSLVGATRTLTQLFSYEAPFLLALLGPAMVAGSWQISAIVAAGSGHWLVLSQPIGFLVALIGLMGKLEMPPFDAPEAETEIVAGALTEYGGRGLALFRLARNVELVVGLALIAALYLGGAVGPVAFFAETLVLLGTITLLRVLFTRLRIDQMAWLWWRGGALLALAQLLAVIVWKGIMA